MTNMTLFQEMLGRIGRKSDEIKYDRAMWALRRPGMMFAPLETDEWHTVAAIDVVEGRWIVTTTTGAVIDMAGTAVIKHFEVNQFRQEWKV